MTSTFPWSTSACPWGSRTDANLASSVVTSTHYTTPPSLSLTFEKRQQKKKREQKSADLHIMQKSLPFCKAQSPLVKTFKNVTLTTCSPQLAKIEQFVTDGFTRSNSPTHLQVRAKNK
jgi:hypothetical protein